ncbi:T9SS type A sorting domain-containing protein [Owenweeksia hongkongensis]|uniref:T9SS type A sorting domain-containing protein n=1 Tax=Owenweeksia hongkongensis TaxID=253245 RepID=UPI003A8FCEF0
MKNLLQYVKGSFLWNYFSINPFRSFANKGVTISGSAVWAALCFLIINATAVAQGTISTHAVYPDNNGSSAVSFEIESTSPVNITDISHVFNATTSSSEVWIRIGGVGSPNSAGDLEVTAANGWVLDQTATVSGGGGANSAPVSLQNLTEIAIPANTPVGVVITGGMRYSGSNAAPPTPTAFTDGPVTLRTGGTWGYGGAMSTLTNSPRGFLGTVTYELGVKGNCANSFTNFVIDSISGTSAKISWSPGAGNSSFYLEYGATGFTPGTGTKVTGAYPGAQPPVVLNGLTPSTSYDIYFGEICNSGSDSVYFPTPQQFSTSKTCSPVLNFSASNLTSSSADFSWTHASAASDFDIIYGTPGFDPANAGTTVNTTSSPYTLSSLSGNTDYDAYIVADCGGTSGLSDTTGPISIKTLCGTYSAPYYNGFETDPQDAPPVCWSEYVTGTSAFVEVEDFTGAAAPYAGTQALYLYSGSSSTTPGTDTLIAISPQFSDLPTGDKQIRFYANADDPVDTLIIGTIPNKMLGAPFTPIDTVTFATPDTYQEVILQLTTANGYNGTDEYIVFMHNLGGTFDYIRIDEFNYETIPACPKVSNISLTGIGVTDASFTFSGSGSSYDVEFGPTGFTQGTGCTGTFGSNNITIDNTTSPGCATQLGGNTTYDIYIRNNCTSASNGTSIWEGPFTFTTLCAPFTAPYYNGFETDPQDAPPVCWGEYVTGTSAFVEVEDFTATAAPYAGSQALYLYSGSSSTTPGNDTLFAYTPAFSDLPAGDKRIRFWANSDASADRLIVGSAPDPYSGVINPIDTIVFPTADTYQRVIVEFTAANGYNGTDQYIVLMHDLGVTTDYIRIDEFNYELIPPCQAPFQSDLGVAAITATSAKTFWGSTSQGSKTYVEVGTTGFVPGIGNHTVLDSVAGNVDTLLVTGLAGQTTYDFYVQDSCLPGGLSGWVGPFTFTTKCVLSPITLPMHDGFETYTGPISTDDEFYCGNGYSWTVTRPGNTGDILFSYTPSTAPSTPYAGSQSAGFQSLSSSEAIFMTLTSDLSNYTSSPGVELSFYWAEHADEVNPNDRVWARGSVNDPWIEILDWNAANSTSWEYFSIDLKGALATAGQSLSTSTQVRFGQQDNAALTGGDGFSIDEVRLTELTCLDPTNLVATHIGSGDASLQWDGSSSAALGYQVWYGPVGFYQGTLTVGGTKMISSGDSSYVSGFTPQTCYEYVVRGICSAGDSSQWVGPFAFCTTCVNQLSGTYTIGGAAGPNNFPTWDSAATSLNGCGVSGPVVFNVAPGTYNEHITLNDITGASATNTITFNGGDTSLVEITHTSTTDEPTIYFNGADYVNIKNITVSNNSTSDAWGLMFQNGSDNNTVDSCHIKMPVTTTFEIMGIVASASLSSATSTGNNANNLTVSNCMITGGETGIHLEGTTTAASYNAGNQILNNIFRFQDDHGIEVDGQVGLKIIGNDVDSLVNIQAEGIYLQNVDDFVLNENRVIAPDWAVYITDGNDGFTPSVNSQIVNNMIVSSTDYGIYLNDFESTDVFHNSVVGEPALLINDQSNAVAIKNNIFYSTGDYAFESSDALNASDDIDYNLYYSAGTDAFEILSTVYTDLAAWQVGDASRNVNSLEGDPVFVDAVFDLHALSNLPNNVADGSVGVTTDIDGDPRSATTPDMGADEFVPVSGDLALINGEFIKGLCLGTNDSVMIQIENLIGSSVNFATDPLTVTYDVTGAATSSGTIVVNTGTLPTGDTITVYGTGIDLSIPGNYTLNAYIDPNAVNTLAFNDTLVPAVDLEVDSNLTVSPKNVTLLTATDSVEICATSAFFGGGNGFFISEISHYYNGGLNPGTKPSYLTSDDYIEVTGVPGSDMEGITLEIYRGTGGTLLKSFTFPAGTVIGPNGTAIIMTGQTGKVSEPSNFLYDGRGGNTTTMGSGDDAGYILREGSTIIDAVTYDAYTFDASTGVTAADWTGQVTGTSGTAGMRLIADDNNTAANWAVVTTTAPQDAQVLNSGVTLPAPPATSGFMWSLNGVPVDTASCTFAGPHTVGGTYNYVATYTNSCGTFTDTVVVTVPNCFSPTSFEGGSTSTSSVFVKWDTTALGSATYEVEYGNIGFTLGTGTNVALAATDSTEITGIATNVCYEYYVRAVCSSSSQSPWVGPIRICPEVDPCDQLDQYSTGLVDNGESALFIGWQGNGGDAAISNTRSQSASNSLWIHDGGTNAASDIVAYFDTISTGAWSIDFSLYVESGSGGYYNIQQNHDPTGTDNQWAGDVYFDTSGTAHVEIDAANTIAGTFTYSQGQWINISTVIDLDNDTVWVEYNGSSTGIGWAYSNYNPGEDLQFNGVNFYSGVLTGQTYDIDYYVDDFCVNPYIYASCLAPGQLVASNEGCDSVEVSWNSNSGNQSSIIEYGPTGFTPGSGTYVSFVNSPQIISGLTPGTTYEFYVADTCGTTDTSAWAGPISFTTVTGPMPVASFTYTVNGFVVDFNAGASTGGTSYDWDFGDGNNGTGVSTNHTYTAGGTQTVTLTVSNGCGTDDTTIVISSISVFENALGQSLEIYPNPTSGEVNVSFDAFDSEEVVIRILDVSGKQIMSQTDNNANGKMNYSLDISQLADGVYMLEVSAGTLKTNKRLIKR